MYPNLAFLATEDVIIKPKTIGFDGEKELEAIETSARIESTSKTIKDKDGKEIALTYKIFIFDDLFYEELNGSVMLRELPPKDILTYSRKRNPDGSFGHIQIGV